MGFLIIYGLALVGTIAAGLRIGYVRHSRDMARHYVDEIKWRKQVGIDKQPAHIITVTPTITREQADEIKTRFIAARQTKDLVLIQETLAYVREVLGDEDEPYELASRWPSYMTPDDRSWLDYQLRLAGTTPKMREPGIGQVEWR